MILVYFIDRSDQFQARASQHLTKIQAADDEVAIRNLVRMECRVGPSGSGDTSVLSDFDLFFTNPNIRLASLTAGVFDRAAQIRASYGFKTPDSIHLAAAVESGCDRFLTNDLRLTRFTGLDVEILP